MKALKIAGIALVLVAAAIVALLFVGIPASFIVGPMQTDLEVRTGYKLTIAGSSWLRVLPSPNIEVSGVTLTDTRSGSSQLGVTADSIRLTAPLTELFGDRPRISEAVVTRPVIRAPLYRQRSTPVTPPASRASSGSKQTLPPITVNHFAIHDGSVHFVNARGAIESKLEKIELIGSLAADDRIELAASAKSGDQDLTLKLKGTAPRTGFDGTPIPVEFAFELPGTLHGPVAGTAEVRPAGSLIRINSISGGIGPNRFSGWASVDVADKPLVNVDLDFQRLDIGTLRAPGSGSGAAASAATIDQPWSTAPISLDGLNFFDAQINISAASLNYETFHFSPITVRATINNGVVQVAFPQMGLYGGQASGGIAANVSTEQFSYAVRLDVYDVRALPLLTDVANFTTLDGKMTAKIDLRAWGQTERAIMSSLDGTMEMQFQDGEIRSMNIAQMIRNVGATILSGWQAGTSEKTDFANLSATFQFDKGIATTTNLQLAGPLVRVTGVGAADVGAKTLNFRIEPKLVMTLQGQGATAANPVGLGVPVTVQGTWGQPKIFPEMAGMLENPDAAFAKLKELGLGLFGGAAGAPQGQTAPGAAGNQQQPAPGSILQGIGDMLKNFGNNPGSGQPSTAPATPRR